MARYYDFEDLFVARDILQKKFPNIQFIVILGKVYAQIPDDMVSYVDEEAYLLGGSEANL